MSRNQPAITMKWQPWFFSKKKKKKKKNSNIICCSCDWHFKGYRIYPKYSDTSTPYHICSKIWTSTIHYPMLCLKIAGWVANSVDPYETLRSAVSHLGLYCLLRPVCPNTYGKYGNIISFYFMTFQSHPGACLFIWVGDLGPLIIYIAKL